MSATLFERIRAAFWLRRCESVGADAVLYGRPTVLPGGGRILIGARFRFASRPISSHLDAGPDAILEIGDDVWIGHGAAIAAHERVTIGAGTRIGPFVIIMDTNFHGSGSQSVYHDCRPVVIGRGCRIGSRVTITRGAMIGDGAIIDSGSVVTADIPAGARAAGAPATVLA